MNEQLANTSSEIEDYAKNRLELLNEDRLRRNQEQVRTDLFGQNQGGESTVCPCGSMYFELIDVKQYQSSGYSSDPGGSLQPASFQDVRMLRCICGRPQKLVIGGASRRGPTGNKEQAALQDSIDAAIRAFDARGRIAPEEIQQAVTPLLRDVVLASELEERLQTLTDHSVPAPGKRGK